MVARIALILSLMFLTACATRDAQYQQALNLTKEHFRDTATVKDDYLETTATITTVNGFQEKVGLLGIAMYDSFLRAFINKSTGATSYQVYSVIYYRGSGWNFFNTVNYLTESGPRSEPVTVISRDVVDCFSGGFGTTECLYVEHIAFDVEERLLRFMASKYEFSQGKNVGWTFKFKAKSGQEYHGVLFIAEITGLLEKVDEYRASKGFASSAQDRSARLAMPVWSSRLSLGAVSRPSRDSLFEEHSATARLPN